jgi:hypothetical protein
VFVSAAPRARAHVGGDLVSGVEREVEDGRPPEPVACEDGAVLVARPTGDTYRGLPWWVLDVVEV